MDNILLKLFSVIFERLWRLEEATDNWRKVNITPIFKNGKTINPWNYRLVV